MAGWQPGKWRKRSTKRGFARASMTNAGAGVLILLLAACGGSPSYEQPAAAPAISPAAQVGERIFSDTSLSGSRGQACSICHDPANAHAPGNALAAQLGGPNRNLQGVRQAPGIRYLRFNTAFFFDSEGTPTGGFFWDGRASSLQVQAAEPFLNPFEMAMPSKAAVVQRLSQATYATEFRSVFGSNIFADVDLAYDRMTFALAQYQKEDAEFAEFSSKYDAFLRGQATLAAQELRGLALFNDPNKGNCAACHPSAKGADGSLPLFTNFKTLKDALTFYVQRDTNPEKFYPTVGGVVQKFNDLPPQYHPNVNRTEAPYNRNPGDAPALTDAEIDDLVVFLNTLSDGFVP